MSIFPITARTLVRRYQTRRALPASSERIWASGCTSKMATAANTGKRVGLWYIIQDSRPIHIQRFRVNRAASLVQTAGTLPVSQVWEKRGGGDKEESPTVEKDTLALNPEMEKMKIREGYSVCIRYAELWIFLSFIVLPLKAVKVVSMKHRNSFQNWSLKVVHVLFFSFRRERDRDRVLPLLPTMRLGTMCFEWIGIEQGREVR